MRRPFVKMCGFTSAADVREAVLAGADLVGLNFHSGSPRAVSIGLAAQLAETARTTPIPSGRRRPVRTVAVFVDPDPEHVDAVLEHVRPDVLQFHGHETPEFCRSWKRPFLKAFPIRVKADADTIGAFLGGYAVGYLVDAWSPGTPGGTGRQIAFETAHYALKHPRGFLAGGLTPDNVEDLVRRLRPYGVDVASGIETRPGVKSPKLMAEFVQRVEAACRG